MKKFYLGVKLLTLASLFVIANVNNGLVANGIAGIILIVFALSTFMEFKEVE